MLFLLAVAVIVVYKLLDNLGFIFSGIGRMMNILTPFFIGFAIAWVLNIPCKKLEKLFKKAKWKFINKRARAFGILSAYVILAVGITLVLSFLIPAISRSMIDLVAHLPEYWDAVINFINNRVDVTEYLGNFGVQDIVGWFDFEYITRGVIGVTSGVFTGILAVVSSIYMLLDKDRIFTFLRRGISIIAKKNVSDKFVLYVKRVNEIFSKFVHAQLLDATIVWIASTTILLIMDVQYAVFLGFMIGLSNMIPYFGSLVSSVIAVIITMLTGGFTQGIWVAVALLILQQIDGNIIAPRLIGRKLNVRPIGIIIALTIGGGLFGLLGMFLAEPAFAFIKTVVVEYMDIFEEKRAVEVLNPPTD